MFKSTHASTGHCWSIGSIAVLITDTAIPIHQTNVLTGVKKSREKIKTATGEDHKVTVTCLRSYTCQVTATVSAMFVNYSQLSI